MKGVLCTSVNPPGVGFCVSRQKCQAWLPSRLFEASWGKGRAWGVYVGRTIGSFHVRLMGHRDQGKFYHTNCPVSLDDVASITKLVWSPRVISLAKKEISFLIPSRLNSGMLSLAPNNAQLINKSDLLWCFQTHRAPQMHWRLRTWPHYWLHIYFVFCFVFCLFNFSKCVLFQISSTL